MNKHEINHHKTPRTNTHKEKHFADIPRFFSSARLDGLVGKSDSVLLNDQLAAIYCSSQALYLYRRQSRKKERNLIKEIPVRATKRHVIPMSPQKQAACS